MPKIEIPIPTDYLCPITHELMMDPVSTADGHIYERKAIEKWLQDHHTSPVTNLPLKYKELTVIPFVKEQIQSFIKQNKLCTREEFLEAIKETVLERRLLFKLFKLNYHFSYLDAQEDSSGFTALHRAAWGRHIELVAWLLAEGASTKAKDNSGSTPLHVAGCAEIAELLLEEGADLEALDQMGETPLHHAAAAGRAEVVKLLLSKGANLTARNHEGHTPETLLDLAASMSLRIPGNYDKTKYFLLVNNPDIEKEHSAKLHLAIQYKQVDTIKGMLWEKQEYGEEAKLDLKAKDKEGFTPLHLATRQGLTDVVKALLIEKVSPNNNVILFGCICTPLHDAVSRGYKDIVQLLLEYGADNSVLNHEQLTPAQLAEKNGKIEILKLFQLYEAPKKVAELEKITQQQSHLIQLIQHQMNELTQQLQQLENGQSKNNYENRKQYNPHFNYTKR